MSKRKATVLEELLYSVAQTIADAKHGSTSAGDSPPAAAAAAAGAGQGGQGGQRRNPSQVVVDETKLQGQARGFKRLRITPTSTATSIVQEFEKQLHFKNLYEIVTPAELQSISDQEKIQIIQTLQWIRSIAPDRYKLSFTDIILYRQALIRRIYFKRYFQRKRDESLYNVKNLGQFQDFNVPRELQTIMGQYYLSDNPVTYQYNTMPAVDIIDILGEFDHATFLKNPNPQQLEKESQFKLNLQHKILSLAPVELKQEWKNTVQSYRDPNVFNIIYSEWYLPFMVQIGLHNKNAIGKSIVDQYRTRFLDLEDLGSWYMTNYL